MNRAGIAATTIALSCSLAAALRAQQPQELPRFTTAVDVTSLDASVYDDRGRPITDLKPSDFAVRVDGDPRQVLSAEWITLSTPERPVPPPPQGYSTNESATGGRLILIVVDQPNIRFGGAMAIRGAVNAFIDRLQPADRAAVIGIGNGSPATPFTADRARLKRAVQGMTGQYVPRQMMSYNVALSEALDIRNSTPGVLDRVINRECRSFNQLLDGPELEICISEVEREAEQIAFERTTDGRDTINTLRALLTALKAIDAPKTMVFVSEGFLIDNDTASVVELGSIAAAARTSIYTLKLDDQLFHISADTAAAPVARMDDRFARAEGLELLAGSSRGALFNIIGTGANIFERIEAELSGYYLIGVASGPSDRDGKVHPIRVSVNRKDVTVRARRALYAPPNTPVPRGPRQQVAAAMASPLPVSALPLRVATFSLLGPEVGKVQLLIHADVGTDYTNSRLVALAYTVANSDGLIIESQAAAARLPPMMSGVPSPLQFSGGASLPPGEYTLKLAMAEGDRVGTVEHQFRAEVVSSGRVQYSDLMAGNPDMFSLEPLKPSVGYEVIFGALQGYVEVYGPALQGITAKYEVAKSLDGEPLLSADVAPVMIGSGRAIFTKVMPIRQLPPGKYVLRAAVSAGSEPSRTFVRPFEVSSPAVLMTSAATSGDVAMPVTEVFLPVPDAVMTRGFDPAEALQPQTVGSFRSRVAETQRPAFDAGVSALEAATYAEAEKQFKAAISPDEDSSAAIAYLAATYAAAGHDLEASSAWQTSLIDSSDSPQIYDWLSGALLRSRSLPQARGTLEEAVAKWPSDLRFAKPLAIMYAMFGQGPQAVRSLERHLTEQDDDLEALALGVEWIYQLRQANAVAHSPAEDVRLARRYADRYLKANGPQSALVRQWMEFLEARPR